MINIMAARNLSVCWKETSALKRNGWKEAIMSISALRSIARTDRIIMMGAIDNLVKGAAGQAVQNMNLMFGLPGKRRPGAGADVSLRCISCKKQQGRK